MTFISYAQNFEDVTLWRTLKLFGPGYYIDVGANDPVVHSVTHSLYERGWRGINIEPIACLHQKLAEQRPEDINLCAAVSDAPGQMVFYESTPSGLSTLDPERADTLRQEGFQIMERTVPVRTLADICEAHLKDDRPFQFLKIDVECMEGFVLRGMDFNRWRPWVILLESPIFNDPPWEKLLTDAGYTYVHSDAINRYFVANEHANLATPLRMPPNILDGFHLCEGHTLAHPTPDSAAMEQALVAADERIKTLENELAGIYGSTLWALSRPVVRLLQAFKTMTGSRT